MNAPWKPGPLGNRDPFAAFICDEAALDVLRPVVIEMGWQPEKCNKGGLRNAVQSLSIAASPAILMVDLSESGDPLNDINALAEVCEPGTVVIAVGQVNDVRLYRDLLASGIHDYLLKPLSASQLRDSLTQAQAVFIAPAQQRRRDGQEARLDRGRRHPRRRRRLDAGDLARLAVQRRPQEADRAARSRRPFRHRRAGARSRAGPRPDRRDREPEPHRRAVHRARDDPRQRATSRSSRPKRRSTRR